MKAHITDRDVNPEDRSSSPRLVVRFDGQVVQEITLPDELCIGRAKDNDLKISDAKAARHHARLYWDGSRYQIADLDSATGTWINGIRLIGSRSLRDGERITIGNAELVYHEADEVSTGPAASRLEATLDDLELAPLPSLPDSWEANRRWRLAARLVTGLVLIAALAASAFFLLGPDSFEPVAANGSATPSLAVTERGPGSTPLVAAEIPAPTALARNPAQFEDQLTQAWALAEQSRFDEALAAYQDLAQQAPDDARPEIGWAWALILDGQPDLALEHARRAVGLDPLNAESMIALSRAYLAVGDTVPALGMAQNAVELDGQSAPANAALAEALLRKGQLEQAVEAAELALAQDPQSAEAHRVRGWLYREVTDRAGAVAEFQAAADLQPELWLRHYELGLAHAWAGEHGVAIAALTRALDLRRDPLVYAALGGAYLGAGQLDQAGSFLEQALAAGAADANTYGLLALVHAQGERCDDARGYYERALQQEPTNSVAVEARNLCEIPTPTPTATPTELPPTPALAPLAGRIAFPVWNAARGKYDTYLANAAGSGRRLVVQEMHQPAFSPGGQWLAVNGDRPNHMNLFVVRADGSELFEVTAYVEDGRPAWSPDGSRLVFSSTRHGDQKSRLYIVDPVQFGGEMVPARLIVSDLYELLGQDPAWTAGAQIVYAGCDYFNTPVACGLFAISAESGPQTPRQISDHPGDAAPAVSGQQVAFMSNRDGNWEIYVVNDDGSGLRRLTRNPANDGLPTWSPDGRTLAFVSDRGGAWAVWAANPDGSGQRKLFDMGGGGLAVDWQEEQISWGP